MPKFAIVSDELEIESKTGRRSIQIKSKLPYHERVKTKFILFFMGQIMALGVWAQSLKDCPLGREISESELDSLSTKGILSSDLKIKLRKPEDLICCLPETYRKNYVVAPRTQSARISTAYNPRVILFSSLNVKGTLKLQRALTFLGTGGDPDLEGDAIESDPGKISVEILQNSLQDERKTDPYTFTDLSFRKSNGGDFSHVPTASPNDESCVRCHGGSAKSSTSYSSHSSYPIFPRDPIWPALFGQFGILTTGAEFPISRSEFGTELSDLKKFRETLEAGKDKRYSCLIGLKERVECEIQRDEVLLAQFKNQSDKSCVNSKQLLDEKTADEIGKINESQKCQSFIGFEQKNFEFSSILHNTERDKVFNLLKKTPDYNKFKYSLLGSVICPSIPLKMFYPKPIQNILPQASELESKALAQVKKFKNDMQRNKYEWSKNTESLLSCDREKVLKNIDNLSKRSILQAQQYISTGRQGASSGAQAPLGPDLDTLQLVERFRMIFLGRGLKGFDNDYDDNFGMLLSSEGVTQALTLADSSIESVLGGKSISLIRNEMLTGGVQKIQDVCTQLVTASLNAFDPKASVDPVRIRSKVKDYIDAREKELNRFESLETPSPNPSPGAH